MLAPTGALYVIICRDRDRDRDYNVKKDRDGGADHDVSGEDDGDVVGGVESSYLMGHHFVSSNRSSLCYNLQRQRQRL